MMYSRKQIVQELQRVGGVSDGASLPSPSCYCYWENVDIEYSIDIDSGGVSLPRYRGGEVPLTEAYTIRSY